MSTASDLQEAKEQVEELFALRQVAIAQRVEQLRRLKTPEETATEGATAQATTDAQTYINSILG